MTAISIKEKNIARGHLLHTRLTVYCFLFWSTTSTPLFAFIVICYYLGLVVIPRIRVNSVMHCRHQNCIFLLLWNVADKDAFFCIQEQTTFFRQFFSIRYHYNSLLFFLTVPTNVVRWFWRRSLPSVTEEIQLSHVIFLPVFSFGAIILFTTAEGLLFTT